MRKLKALPVIVTSAALALLVALVLVWPLLLGAWADFQRERAAQREFVAASDAVQQAIVRSYLECEMRQPPLCNPQTGACPKALLYFDSRSAVLASSDSGEPWDRYEYRVLNAEREGALVDRADTSAPVALQETLDKLTREVTRNANPLLPGVTYVDAAEKMPILGLPGSCGDVESPKLVRMSRAVVQVSEGFAIALVAVAYCDASVAHHVAKFQQRDGVWVALP